MGKNRVITSALVIIIVLSLNMLTAGCGGGGATGGVDAITPVAGQPTTVVDNGTVVPTANMEVPTLDELTALLTAELERMGKDSSETKSFVPRAEADRVFDLTARQVSTHPYTEGVYRGQVKINWTNVLRGDYNKDGAVTTGDLAPLAYYWQESVEYDPPELHGGIAWWPKGNPIGDEYQEYFNWRKAIVDGNRNGLIEMADLSVLAQHYLESVDFYRVYRRGPLAVTDQWEAVSGVSDIFSHWRTKPPYDYLPVTCEVEEYVIAGGIYEYAVVPVDNGEEGLWSVIETIEVDANAKPIALLAADVQYGRCPLTVHFDWTGSLDPEGAATTFELFLQPDDNPVYTGTQDSPTTLDYIIDQSNTYHTQLEVTDANGVTTKSETVLVRVVDNMEPEVVCSASPLSGVAPLTVTFDFTGTTDPDGEVVEYIVSFFDTYGYQVKRYSAEPIIEVTFHTPGKFHVLLDAMDNESGLGYTWCDIEVLDEEE